MVSTWMGDHSVVEVDDVEKNSVKSLEWRNGASNKNFLATKFFFGLHVQLYMAYYLKHGAHYLTHANHYLTHMAFYLTHTAH